MSKRFTPEEMEAAVQRNIAAAQRITTTQSGGKPPGPAETIKRIPLEKIMVYEGNPRKITNEKFLEIKDSIRAKGLKTPFFVTRRPQDLEQDFWVQSRGGATRLAALRAILEEDRAAGVASLYETVDCIAEHYVDETSLMVDHLIENMQRSDMGFWDSATGMMNLKAELEQSSGETLSLRELEAETGKLGMGIGHSTLGLYYFAVYQLILLGNQCTSLSATNVKDTIRPAYLTCQRLVSKGGLAGQPPLDDDAFKRIIAEPTLRAYAATATDAGVFEPVVLARELELATAHYMGVDPKLMPKVLAAHRADASAALADLLPKEQTSPRAPEAYSPKETSADESSVVDEDTLGDYASAEVDPRQINLDGVPERPPLPPVPHAPRELASGGTGGITQEDLARAIAAAQTDAAGIGGAAAAGVMAGMAAAQQVSAATPLVEAGAPAPTAPGNTFTAVPAARSASLTVAEYREAIVRRVRGIAQVYGLEQLVLDAPAMPLGYVMELPTLPFANTDTAGEGWAFLAYTSGIALHEPLDIQRFMPLLPPAADGSELKLMEYADCLVTNDLDGAQSLLGDVPYPENMGVFLWSALWPSAPLSAELHALFGLLRDLNTASPTLWWHPLVPHSTPFAEVPRALGFTSEGGDHE